MATRNLAGTQQRLATVQSELDDIWLTTVCLIQETQARFDDLVKAYVTYPAIQVYALILVAALAVGIATIQSIPLFFLSLVLGALIFPIAWYITHRFSLHGSWMYKTPWLAGLWKRVHYDHHRYPNDLSVLFGGLHTTLPPILLIAGPVGWLIGGLPCACAAVASPRLSAPAANVVIQCFMSVSQCVSRSQPAFWCLN